MIPPALREEFATDRDKVAQWRAFLRRSNLEGTTVALPQVLAALREFLLPPPNAAAIGKAFKKEWSNGGPWV